MISVIMPVYKTEYATLRRAVDSVRRQTFSDWELFLVDDNDGESPYFAEVSRLAREETDVRVRFLRGGVNRGANAARNTGLAAARGELVAFCDSDDAWAPEYLARVSDFFAAHPEAALFSVSYRIRRVGASREMRHRTRVEALWEKEIYADRLSPTTAVSARRAALLSAGGFDERLEARQDYDLWLRACRLGAVGFTEEILADIYQDGAGHERISGNYLRHIRATERVLSKILETVPIERSGGWKPPTMDTWRSRRLKMETGRSREATREKCSPRGKARADFCCGACAARRASSVSCNM